MFKIVPPPLSTYMCVNFIHFVMGLSAWNKFIHSFIHSIRYWLIDWLIFKFSCERANCRLLCWCWTYRATAWRLCPIFSACVSCGSWQPPTTSSLMLASCRTCCQPRGAIWNDSTWQTTRSVAATSTGTTSSSLLPSWVGISWALLYFHVGDVVD